MELQVQVGIGLPHRAFVSTFFTRQKELSFFGNLRETDRQREVSRLLGLETIRGAQKLIAEGTDWRFLDELKKELKG